MDDQDRVARILEIIRSFFFSEHEDATYQQVVRFSQLRRTDQSRDEFTVEFDVLRGKAESKIEMGTGIPGHFASTLRMHNAGLPRTDRSLVMGSS